MAPRATMRLHDSLSRQLHVIEAQRPTTIYACGYSPITDLHLANARPFLEVDQLCHALEAATGHRPRLIYDVSDIDPRVDARAEAEGMSVPEWVDLLVAHFLAVLSELGVDEPSVMPRGSDNVDEMVALISRLDELDLVNVHGGRVVLRAGAAGELAGFSGIDPGNAMREALCFMGRQWDVHVEVPLWEPRPEGASRWPSPWGLGAPSEHVPCVALSRLTLGGTMDIHAGAAELYGHHEIEMVLGGLGAGQLYARTWFHTGGVYVDDLRMANSNGNVLTVRDAIDAVGAGAVRILFLSAHYREPLDASRARLEDARERFARLTRACAPILTAPSSTLTESNLTRDVLTRLEADLATERALDCIERAIYDGATLTASDLRRALGLLKLDHLVEVAATS
jgi:cysteinyl-tRNA synthetase